MEEDWKTYKLGDLIEINTNTIKKGQTKWIHYIDIKSVGSGTYVDPKRIQFDDAPSRARRLLLEGDTVISSVRPNLKSYFYSQNLKNFTIASTGFAVLSPRKIDSRFLYYLTTNDRYIDFLVKSCTGSAYPAFGPNVIVESEVTIPRSLPEQHAIASILSALDDKIELNLQMNKTLEEMAMILYKHWFVDFGPFRDGEFVSSELGEIPKGWEVKTIGELYKTTSGGTPSRKKLEFYQSGNIPWVKSKELYENYVIDTEEKITQAGLDSSSAKLIPSKSILLAMYGATVGESSILAIEATCNQAICAIIQKNISYLYAFLFLRFNKNDILNQAVGSAQQNISQEIIKGIKMISPPPDLIFFAELETYFNLMHNNTIENATLSNLRNTLLPKLISGEVRVKDAALTIAEVL